MNIIVHCDGGARGNPGPAAVGSVIKVGYKLVGTISKTIGKATNNQAEYQAVIESLNWIEKNQQELKLEEGKLVFYLDSNLVVNQLAGNFKIKQNHLKDLALKAHHIINRLNLSVQFNYIPREQNQQADSLVNQALDQLL